MAQGHPHLRIEREEPVTERRPGGRRFPAAPADPIAHGEALRQGLHAAKERTAADIGGFDERRLFRFSVEKGFDPEDLLKISPEIEFVSQEGDEVVVAFVSDAALESFEARLSSLVHGEKVPYKQVLFALKGFDGWSADDRKGWALRRQGFPEAAQFSLDVELWPIEQRSDERERLWRAFEAWLKLNAIESLDKVIQAGLILYRVNCTRDQAELLLHHRDVRTVDLPPRYGLDLQLLAMDIQEIAPPRPPPDNAPGIAILDSGLATGHPLLAPAVGDAQSFLPGHDASDEHGHGTHVAGLALYGDVDEAARSRRFLPELRLFSGRILDARNENETGFVENQIDEAVRYFHGGYGCRVFNLSFGDRNKPYDGRHVRGLAFTLDRLSRELGVLFVVSAGNVLADQQDGLAWKNNYPDYLAADEWTIVDPATALNVLTVGSLARYDQSSSSRRYPTDPAETPIARREQPSPFTRHGPTVGGAIKPELVAFGGNWALNTRAGAYYIVQRGLGELSTSSRFAAGRLLGEQCGTSFAAPHVAHLAGRLLTELPTAAGNLLKALLVVHASVPQAGVDASFIDHDSMQNICGYGRVDSSALFRSLESAVTLLAEARIENKRHHFYEVPIPPDFTSAGRRLREIAVALAHTPPVRTTRINYKACRLDFKLAAASDLEHVVKMFNRATSREEYENISELSGASVGARLRGKSTVQAATWQFRQFNRNSRLRHDRLFVVVTRNDYGWGEAISAAEEEYAVVVCLRDRENLQARLYTQIQNQLQIRERLRARV
jgi:hypothetical protein